MGMCVIEVNFIEVKWKRMREMLLWDFVKYLEYILEIGFKI